MKMGSEVVYILQERFEGSNVWENLTVYREYDLAIGAQDLNEELYGNNQYRVFGVEYVG